MRKLLITLCFMAVSFCFAQKENIELPNIKGEIRFSKTTITPIFSVYVNANEEVYFENQKVSIEKLGDTIFKYRNKIPIENTLLLQIHLLADKNVPHKLIDKVQSQVTSAKTYLLPYRTGNIEDVSSGIFFFRLYDKFGALEYKEESIEEYENSEDEVSIDIDIPLVLDPEEIILKNKLYALKFVEFKTSLKDYSYSKVKFIGSKKILIDGKKYKLRSPETIAELILKKDFLITTFSEKLSYNDYLNNIVVLKKIYQKQEKKQLKTPFYFEISGELQKEMDKQGFKL